MSVEVFGHIVTSAHVEAAVIDALQTWEETYLAEIERQSGLDPHTLPKIRSWTTSRELRKWPEDQLPAVVVVSPGTVDRTHKSSDHIAAKWLLGLAIVCSGRTQEETNQLAKFYAGAFRAALLQNPSLGGLARGVTWQSERNNEVGSESERSIASCQAIFEVDIDQSVGTERYGMTEPPDDPYDPDPTWPTVEETEVTVGAMED